MHFLLTARPAARNQWCMASARTIRKTALLFALFVTTWQAAGHRDTVACCVPSRVCEAVRYFNDLEATGAKGDLWQRAMTSLILAGAKKDSPAQQKSVAHARPAL
jgi:hypothetical protein